MNQPYGVPSPLIPTNLPGYSRSSPSLHQKDQSVSDAGCSYILEGPEHMNILDLGPPLKSM
jgi:hypothetical protein